MTSRLSDSEIFSRDPEALAESLEEVKARISRIAERNRAMRERLASTPAPTKARTVKKENAL